MVNISEVGRKISALRKARGLTGEQLAELIHVTPQAISKWENGKCLPETATLPLLARALACSIDEILKLTEDVIEKNKISSFEDIITLDRDDIKRVLEKFEKVTLVKAAMGASPG